MKRRACDTSVASVPKFCRPRRRSNPPVERSQSGGLSSGRRHASGGSRSETYCLAVILRANLAAVNSVRPVSFFESTLQPTLRDSKSPTPSASTTSRDRLCAHCYFLRPSRGASRLASNSQLPTSYQKPPRGKTSRRFAFSPIFRGIFGCCPPGPLSPF